MLETYLKTIPLFKHLGESQLQKVASRCKNVSFKKGSTIFYRTDSSTDLYIVISGKLKAVLTDEEGDDFVLAYFERGTFFGELSFLDGKPRSATIVAEEDSGVAVLQRGVLFDLLAEDPGIAVELIRVLVERLRKADEMIESLAFLEVSERLIRALLDRARTEEGKSESYIRSSRITHKELASLIGSSREAVTKGMKALVSKGIIKEEGDHILIARKPR